MAALAVLLAGCGEEVPEALAELTTGIDTEIGDGPVPPQEGAEAAGEPSLDDETYPDALPEEFPLPGGTELLESSTEEVDGATVVTLEAAYQDDFDQAVLFYDTELPAAGWEITDTFEGDEDANPTERWYIEGFGWAGQVELRQRDDPGDAGGRTMLVVELRDGP